MEATHMRRRESMPRKVKQSKKIIKGMLIIYNYKTKYLKLWQIKKAFIYTQTGLFKATGLAHSREVKPNKWQSILTLS